MCPQPLCFPKDSPVNPLKEPKQQACKAHFNIIGWQGRSIFEREPFPEADFKVENKHPIQWWKVCGLTFCNAKNLDKIVWIYLLACEEASVRYFVFFACLLATNRMQHFKYTSKSMQAKGYGFAPPIVVQCAKNYRPPLRQNRVFLWARLVSLGTHPPAPRLDSNPGLSEGRRFGLRTHPRCHECISGGADVQPRPADVATTVPWDRFYSVCCSWFRCCLRLWLHANLFLGFLWCLIWWNTFDVFFFFWGGARMGDVSALAFSLKS